ncbi:glycine betaine ABC transporter substrate-binding protein [Cognatishimia sp. SS12]|uniref:glycine betaine ABC transporter substrate-binding protein n=1 Tax=Cognatishimia sp. SS12 TaxID=2979465 RepID=UPI002330C942|nr:glycine betaine ABC transporter substrate-binding protein [Cognatishimia sp. SS12]MDC0739528.1 glycine betaine ABC transporter substrate-binding protein [Cognatishimia sp. SS12]
MFNSIQTALKGVALAAALTLPAVASADTIKVGGKNFTEQLLMAEMTATLLEAKGFDVDMLDGMGTSVLRAAMENGQIDVYWEYTGTSLVTFNKITEPMDAAATYAKVKELDAAVGITWLDASNANNTYALAVRAGDDKGLNSLSDLAAAYESDEKPTMGVNIEFPKRADGLPGLQAEYGFKTSRRNLAPMESGLVYEALKEGKVDVGLVFATDGRIAAFDFKVLEDDRGYFPNYALAPTIRTEVLEANPELADILNGLAAKLSDDVMQQLNAQVDVEKKTIEDVASEFLSAQGLI